MNTKKVYPQYFIYAAIIVYSLLFIIPTISGLYFSLTNWNAMSDNMKFIGLDNFKEIFKGQSVFIKYVINTFLFAFITATIKTVFGFLLAVLFNKSINFKNIYRAIFFLPVVLSPLIIGIIFTSILSPDGLFNNFLGTIGLESAVRPWLADKIFALPAVMSVEVWRNIGFNMVIFLAGMQAIPKDYYEAASIDGAKGWDKMMKITLPLVMPAITINIIMNVINGLKVFDLVYVLTNGGPGNATGVLMTGVFKEFSSGRYALGTTVNVVVFILTLIIAFGLLRSLNKKEESLQ